VADEPGALQMPGGLGKPFAERAEHEWRNAGYSLIADHRNFGQLRRQQNALLCRPIGAYRRLGGDPPPVVRMHDCLIQVK
jgi:hypothetical protein